MTGQLNQADTREFGRPIVDRPEHYALIDKLERSAGLDRAERDALRGALRVSQRTLSPRATLIDAGEAPGEVHVVIDGWASRYRQLSDGTRQIVAIYLPGDVCDLDACLSDRCRFPIEAIDTLRVAVLPRKQLAALTTEHPRIECALRQDAVVGTSIQREWTVNVGRRNAKRRVSHLLCELATRLTAIGLGSDDHYPFPLTQRDIADACGITPVHANRTLQDLRAAGLIALFGRSLDIRDRVRLERLGDFDRRYLELGSRGAKPVVANGKEHRTRELAELEQVD